MFRVVCRLLDLTCSHLESMNLAWRKGVSDANVMSLANGYPTLRTLKLSCCALIRELVMLMLWVQLDVKILIFFFLTNPWCRFWIRLAISSICVGWVLSNIEGKYLVNWLSVYMINKYNILTHLFDCCILLDRKDEHQWREVLSHN